ncbi:MAG: cell division protein FtsL [Cypionkella sp.]
MRPVLYILSFLAVLGLAFWAYRENYATQHQLKQMASVQDQIASMRDEIAMQKAEWAYLNRPDRLRDLAAINFDRLGLMPIQPQQLGTPETIAMPAPQPLIITGTVDTSAAIEAALSATRQAASTGSKTEQVP